MRAAFIVFVTSLVAFATGHAACSAQSGADRRHLVELYTSEGCDSCPPAEKWMSTLGKHPELIGLEFHVDYWDDVHWRDPFSDHAYTLRQQALANRVNRGTIFTPQIWLDGQVWQNWPKGAPPALITASTQPLRVTVDGSDIVRVHIDATTVTAQPDYRLYAALTQSGLSEFVRGGENHGKHLDHDNVVRAFAGPLSLPQADIELKAPQNPDLQQSAVVAFVQDESNGSVVQAVRVALQCSK
jgi:hypothetical protein